MTPWQPLQLTLYMGLVLEFNPQGIEFHPNALFLTYESQEYCSLSQTYSPLESNVK